MEAIKHLFGFCGETWHPSLLTVGMFAPFIIFVKQILYKLYKLIKLIKFIKLK